MSVPEQRSNHRAAMVGADVIMAELASRNVSTVFSLPGTHVDPLFAAADRYGLRIVTMRHESAAALAAIGYSQATGQLGVVMTIPGIGLLHTVGSLSIAHACNVPVLCLAVGIERSLEGRSLGAHHEVPQQLSALAPVCKWAVRIADAHEIQSVIGEAVGRALRPRCRPVCVEVPYDCLTEEVVTERVGESYIPSTAETPGGAVLADVCGRLEAARRPSLYVGGGAIASWALVRQLSNVLDAPVVMTTNGLGIQSDESPTALRTLGGKIVWRESDVVLVLGSRSFAPLLAWTDVPRPVLIRVDVDEHQLGRPVPPDIAVRADCTVAVNAILDHLDTSRISSDWSGRAGRLQRRARALLESAHAEEHALLAAIRDSLSDSAIFVLDSTQMGYFCIAALPATQPRTILTSGYQGAIGYSLAAGIGAKLGSVGREVVVVIGDGGFQTALGELATLAQHKIKLVVLLFNNSSYGEVERLQLRRFGVALQGARLVNPDFQAVCRAFGLLSARVTSPDELRVQVAKACDANGSTVIEVTMRDLPPIWDLPNRFEAELEDDGAFY